MNREQRRAQKKHIVLVPVEKLVMPHQAITPVEARIAAQFRLQLNLETTQHPFHHKTENGAIVEPDPTLEYFLGQLPVSESADLKTAWKSLVSPTAPKATPVNRRFYGFDPFEKH